MVADDGFPGTVVRVLTAGVEERERDGRVELTVQAGEEWEPFVARCVAEGLAGVESLSGIPGSIGATPIQNVGAYGQEVAETVVSVRVLDRERDVVEELPAADCGFAYRSSAFKRNPGRWVVLAVTFALERRELSGPLDLRRAGAHARRRSPARARRSPTSARRCSALRRGKGMVLDPADPDSVSAGSFFTNPILEADAFAALEARAAERPPRFPEDDGRVKTSAAWLIERAGFAARPRRPERHRDLLQAHARAHQPRRGHDRRAARARPRDRRRGARALRRHARAGADAGRRRLAVASTMPE